MRLILFLFALLPYLYDLFQLVLIDRKRREPLPSSVASVYSKERWDTFVRYKKDSRGPYLLNRACGLALTAFVIFSPFYAWMERITANVYLHTMLAAFVISLISLLFSYPIEHYMVFHVREKYGLNKMNEAEFRKDQLTDALFSLVLTEALYLVLTWILESLPGWTNNYQVSFVNALFVMACIALLLIVFVCIAQFLSWKMLRVRYHFTDLPEGDLRRKIEALLEGSRHKVKGIEVYDESKKSTSKNAFVVKLLLFRSIGIADNFLNENSERELLAVLSHEAGHLKHKRDFRNYLAYGIYAAGFLACVFAIQNGAWLASLEANLNSAFGLSVRNTMLTADAVEYVMTPLFWLISVYMNYVSRSEEYEADRNAVKEGYGPELIETFRNISNDELVDVNPDALVEALEFDHPGMANRIEAIQRAIEARPAEQTT